jgi:hypothetical protein
MNVNKISITVVLLGMRTELAGIFIRFVIKSRSWGSSVRILSEYGLDDRG